MRFTFKMLVIAGRLLFALMLITQTSFHALSQQKSRKTVFIIVDGIPADLVEKLPLPHLQSIARQGGYSRSYVGGQKGTYSQTPTISAVGYNSVLTGVWVNKHNVWDNDIAAPNYHYPTIFRLLKEQFPQKKVGIFSSWQDNRTKLVGDKLAATGNYAIDYTVDGFELDTVNFPHDKQREFMRRIDDSVATKAANIIRTSAPDLSWVYLEHTDDMGHMYGDGPQFYEAISNADKRVGYIWDAVQYRQQHANEEWLIIVTTDHGRDAATGKGHGGQSARERDSWIFTNAQHLNEAFHAPQASATDIMPTIARFMQMQLPRDIAFEMDGMPLIGALSFTSPTYTVNGQQLIITWKAIEKKGQLKLWGARSNQFKTGGKDEYVLITQCPVAAEKLVVDLMEQSSPFYKIVLQAADNSSNYWLKTEEKK